MKIIGVIPARYASSRFPGKPLADIEGKPMIWWVYQQAKKVKEIDEVYVATDDKRIEEACKQHDMTVIMTSDKHKTGTDRVTEVAGKIKADLYMVIMGDEPLILGKDISIMINKILDNPGYDAGMLTKKYSNPVDIINPTTIKLALNNNNELIYISRSAIPFPKARIDFEYFKNIGAYIFPKETLDFYKNTPIGYLESIEEIEMLRLIENHKKIITVKIDSDSFSVDTQKDLERIREIIKNRHK